MQLKATSYKDGEKVTCPYCKSIQVKAMSNQPKKYPYPEGTIFSNKKEIAALREVWHKGYDCKKCGNEFIAIPWTMTPLWENNESVNTQPETQKKKGFIRRLFSFLFKLSLFVLALIIGLSILIGYDRF